MPMAAFAAFLEYRQVENTVIKYNQTASELSNIDAWWKSLTLGEKVDTKNIDRLMKETEGALSTELTGWVKQMQDTIDKLYAKKEEDTRASIKTSTPGSQ
jgi:arsenate reductase-like glutaredoxin family protein